jgi:basic membrane protein A
MANSKLLNVRLILFVVLLGLALVVTIFAMQEQEPDPSPVAPAPAPAVTKVGFIYPGPIGDFGWNFAHDQGRQYLESKLPWVETMKVERVPPGADLERVAREMVQQGATVIFAPSFGYARFMEAIAAQHPNVIFMNGAGFVTAPNLGTYFGRIEDVRFLTGMVAGLKTKTNRLGFVAAHPFSEAIIGLNAFTLGARLVNPQATVQVVWSGTWFDPAREREAAISLLDAGVDVIGQYQDSPASQQAAQERGAFGVGDNSDLRHLAPKATLVGPVWNWGPFYVEMLENIRDGTWKPDQYRWPMPDIVDLSPFNEALVPKEIQDKVMAKRQEIIDGKFHVFAGPIKDQAGTIRVPAGTRMSIEEMRQMYWLVEGVIGSLPAR